MARQETRRKVFYSIALVFSLACVGFGVFLVSRPEPGERNPEASTQEIATTEPVPQSAQLDVAFTGDIFLGRSVDRVAVQNKAKPGYPFAHQKNFKDEHTNWIGNLECPSVNDTVDYQVQFESLIFNCPTSYLKELAQWFSVVSLANNHTDNQGGQAGLKTTRENLDKHNTQYFGNYDMSFTDDICEIVSLPARITYSDQTTKTELLPIALCGYHTVFKLATEEQIAAITTYAKVMPTFVMPHAGAEYTKAAEQLKVDQFRAMIRAGATAVIGAHPHVVQNAEVYKGKLIAYSLGNFIFDQPGFETSTGAILKTQLEIKDGLVLKQWLAIAKSCQTYQDNCLSLLTNIKKSSLSVDYSLQAVDITHYRPEPASNRQQDFVEQRMGWPDVQSKLNDTEVQ